MPHIHKKKKKDLKKNLNEMLKKKKIIATKCGLEIFKSIEFMYALAMALAFKLNTVVRPLEIITFMSL